MYTDETDVYLSVAEAVTAAAVLFGYSYRTTVRYGETVLTSDDGGPDLHLAWQSGGVYFAHHMPGLPINTTLQMQAVEVVRQQNERTVA